MMAMNVRYSNHNQKNDGDELFLCKRCGCIHQLGDRICDKDDTGRHWFTCPECGAHDRYAVPLIDFVASASDFVRDTRIDDARTACVEHIAKMYLKIPEALTDFDCRRIAECEDKVRFLSKVDYLMRSALYGVNNGTAQYLHDIFDIEAEDDDWEGLCQLFCVEDDRFCFAIDKVAERFSDSDIKFMAESVKAIKKMSYSSQKMEAI